MTTSPLGLHRVIEPPGVLPQAAWRLDASPAIAADEVRIRVDRLNLDAASLAGVMTGQSILLIGMMTEGIHTPFLSDRDLALENVRYVRRPRPSRPLSIGLRCYCTEGGGEHAEVQVPGPGDALRGR